MRSNLKQLREARGWSLKLLAEKSGVALSTIGNIEVGRHEASQESLKKLAEALDVTPEDIEMQSAFRETAIDYGMAGEGDEISAKEFNDQGEVTRITSIGLDAGTLLERLKMILRENAIPLRTRVINAAAIVDELQKRMTESREDRRREQPRRHKPEQESDAGRLLRQAGGVGRKKE